MGSVSNQLQRLGVVETISESSDGDVVELLGRVPSAKSDLWGVIMRNVLLAAMKRGSTDCVDFSRYYRLAKKVIQSPGAGAKKAVQIDLVLVWNWRIRYDSLGESLILAECERILVTEARRKMMEEGSIPIRPVTVPGAQVVPVGDGEKDPPKTTRL